MRSQNTYWSYDYFVGVFGNLSDEQLQDMLRSEHGGLTRTLPTYSRLQVMRYMVMAQRLSHKFILDPLLQGEDRLSGLHANTQIPAYRFYDHRDEWQRGLEKGRFFGIQ